MNIVLAMLVLLGRAAPGRRHPRLSRHAAGRRARIEADAPAAQGRRCSSATASCAWTTGRSTTWDEFLFAIAGKARREVDAADRTRRAAADRHVVPTAEGKYEIGDIGVLPNTHPHIRSVDRRRPGREGRPQGRRRHPARSTARQSASRASSPKLISKHEGREIAVRFARNGQTRDVRGHADQARTAKSGAIGIAHQRSVHARGAGRVRSAAR